MQELKVGDPAPDFTLPDENGNLVSLADFRGKRVVLFFYPRDNTPGCTAQACGFRDEFTVIQDKNAVVLGVSGQGAKSHRSFKAKHSLPFPLLSDEDHAVSVKYGVWGEKRFMGMLITNRSHFVIGPDGKLEDVQVGVSPKDSVRLAVSTIGR
ncbi:MAG: thioredoxin-dependent thiol peroxidase [Chloroflexi bacterium]|nr:MAG: thioredoxin-dependent thiol peroxidase [Chloroflexota bacterium]